MVKINALYLSRNMSQYKAAYYQQEFMEALAKKINLQYYGPGFPGFAERNTLANIVAKSDVAIDCIILGHSWLNELETVQTPLVELDLRSAGLPVIAILNKEYNSLDSKLRYLKSQSCALLISHHHRAPEFGAKINSKGKFIPFGYPSACVRDSCKDRPIDLFFSGLLENARGDSARLDAMRYMFHCNGDLPLARRHPFKALNIFWNGIPRQRTRVEYFGYRASRILFPKYSYHHLSRTAYFSRLARSRLVFGSVSPGGLIGPRFFEAMASGAVVFCQESALYDNIFPRGLLVTFSKNLSDFREKLMAILSDEEGRKDLAQQGLTLAVNGSSWESRAEEAAKSIRAEL